MKRFSLGLFFVGVALASGPDQTTRINQAYQAKSRVEAIRAEALRHQEVLSVIEEQQQAALRHFYEENGRCREMKNPAAVQCFQKNTAEMHQFTNDLQRERLEASRIHQKNIDSINAVWDQRAKWDAQARVDAIRRQSERNE